MSTKITVTTTPARSTQKHFYRFDVGEFVVSPRSGKTGIKTGTASVRWLDALDDKVLFDEPGIDTNELYIAPAQVDVRVTL